jgi:hypothetical protein
MVTFRSRPLSTPLGLRTQRDRAEGTVPLASPRVPLRCERAHQPTLSLLCPAISLLYYNVALRTNINRIRMYLW